MPTVLEQPPVARASSARATSGEGGVAVAHGVRVSAVHLCMVGKLKPWRSMAHLRHRQGNRSSWDHHGRLATSAELLAHLCSLAHQGCEPATVANSAEGAETEGRVCS
eukprot:2601384-Prymnesium_polylepis.1